MVAAVRKDTYGVADALYAIGTPTKKVDMRAYRAEVAMLAEKYLGKPLKEIELSGDDPRHRPAARSSTASRSRPTSCWSARRS